MFSWRSGRSRKGCNQINVTISDTSREKKREWQCGTLVKLLMLKAMVIRFRFAPGLQSTQLTFAPNFLYISQKASKNCVHSHGEP